MPRPRRRAGLFTRLGLAGVLSVAVIAAIGYSAAVAQASTQRISDGRNLGGAQISPRGGVADTPRQGATAPGGAYDYLAKGKMIGGFALIAYPAEYGNSGIMTFLVNHDGTVWQKDLGPKTAKLAQKIESFMPDQTWTKADAAP